MPGQRRSASETAAEETITATGDGGASQERADAAATGPGGGRAGSGSVFALLLVLRLPAGVDPKRLLWWGGLAAGYGRGHCVAGGCGGGAGSYLAERWARQDAPVMQASTPDRAGVLGSTGQPPSRCRGRAAALLTTA